MLAQIHPTPLWIENTPQGKVAYFDDNNFIGRMPERKFSISQRSEETSKETFEVEEIKNGKSSFVSRSDIEENNWHLMRALDGFGISKLHDPDMVNQWEVLNGEHDPNGQIVKPGIRVFHGARNNDAWDYIKQHGVTEDGRENFGNLSETFASSSYELAVIYSSLSASGRVGRFIGKTDDFKGFNTKVGSLFYWPSEYNFSFQSARKECVLPDDSTINDEMYELNHQEMQIKNKTISRDKSDQTLRRMLSRTDLRGFRRQGGSATTEVFGPMADSEAKTSDLPLGEATPVGRDPTITTLQPSLPSSSRQDQSNSIATAPPPPLAEQTRDRETLETARGTVPSQQSSAPEAARSSSTRERILRAARAVRKYPEQTVDRIKISNLRNVFRRSR